MEIGLGLIFDKHNIEIVGIDKYDQRINIYEGSSAYPFFSKVALRRQ
jgi:hypothetical protein